MTYLRISGTLLAVSLLAFAAVFQYKRVRRVIDGILIQEAAEPVAIEPEVELEPEPEPVKVVNITAKATSKRKKKKKKKKKKRQQD